MKKVAFIGGYDKIDIILYVSKILTVQSKKVLVIDTTITKKTQYIIPSMNPTPKYITTYDGFDIAIGFENLNEIKQYLSVEGNLDYDYIFVDIDSGLAYEKFSFSPSDMHFLVTTFDVYSLQTGINVIKNFKADTQIAKVLITRNPDSDESEYIDFISLNYKVKWKSDVVYFPFETSDLYAIYENQRFSKIRFVNLSNEFIDAIAELVANITGVSKNEVRKIIKFIERA